MTLAIRGIVPDDADTLLEWRNSDAVRSVSADERLISPDEHARWFAGFLENDQSDGVIATLDGAPVGIARIDRLDSSARTAVWSCNSSGATLPPGVGATLPVIALGIGFERHRLRRMSADVLGSNRNMLGIHRRLGLEIEGRRRRMLLRSDGDELDVVEFGVLAEEWPDVSRRVAELLPQSVRHDLRTILAELAASASESKGVQ